jgi:hypothetical protein
MNQKVFGSYIQMVLFSNDRFYSHKWYKLDRKSNGHQFPVQFFSGYSKSGPFGQIFNCLKQNGCQKWSGVLMT